MAEPTMAVNLSETAVDQNKTQPGAEVDLNQMQLKTEVNLDKIQPEETVELDQIQLEGAMDLPKANQTRTEEVNEAMDLSNKESEGAEVMPNMEPEGAVDLPKMAPEGAVDLPKMEPQGAEEIPMMEVSAGKHVRMSVPEVMVCPPLKEPPEMAVCLRYACKSYGSVKVLNNLNMDVRKGSIYGLLGPSGSGKTTLLGCIVGLQNLNEGYVSVFGGIPGTKGSGVPGPRIGYMPQEVALVAEFDVKGAIYYFGWLFGMSSSQIAGRYQFLRTLLQLPAGNQLIKNLSGGQQRRVSLAAALVQCPELLILDEPTVGLDPVLRQTIWDYLTVISRVHHTTIIITTHYIEEAKQAHTIGLLRSGTLLAESSPNQLLAQYNTTSLEHVFLTLSQQQTTGQVKPQSHIIREDQNSVLAGSDFEEGLNSNDVQSEGVPLEDMTSLHSKVPLYKKSSILPMKALLFKNFTRIFNTYGGLFFLFVFPILELTIFFSAIGKSPTRLPIGIVNDELGDCSALTVDQMELQSGIRLDEETDECRLFGLSCLFMDKLDDYTTVHRYFNDVETAIEATRNGYTAGTIYIPGNFSLNLEQRVRDGKDASNETLLNSEIPVWLDMSEFSSLELRKHLFEGYFQFTDMLSADCKKSNKLTHLPLLFEQPIYGKKHPVYTYFLAPAIIISMIFFLCTTLTISVVSVDRLEKCWDRDLAAGVTSNQIVASHLLAQCVCVVIKMTEALCIGFFVYGMECHGKIADMLLLVFLQGLNGISFGMFISVASKDLTTAAYIGMGSLYPFIFLSGMLWPLEGMPYYLRIFSYCLPNTWATTAFRNILDKGWGFLHPQVYPGFLTTGVWIVGLSMACVGVLNYGKR